MEIDVICVALNGEERSYTFDQFIESTKAVELARKAQNYAGDLGLFDRSPVSEKR